MNNFLENKAAEIHDTKLCYQIAMANEVIDCMSMGLTAQQQDILDFMLKEIKPDDKPDTRYSITIKDFCEVSGISYSRNSKNARDVEKAIKDLNNGSCRWITIPKDIQEKHDADSWMYDVYTDDEKKQMEEERQLIYWFKNISIKPKEGIISYNIYDTMAPYLFGLVDKGHYLMWSYRNIRAMKGRYSKHIYRILLRYYGVKIHNPLIPIEKLKAQLEAENYDRFPDFRRNVLDMAREEINKRTPMTISYLPRKAAGSRAFTHIDFTVKMPEGWGEKPLPIFQGYFDEDDNLPF